LSGSPMQRSAGKRDTGKDDLQTNLCNCLESDLSERRRKSPYILRKGTGKRAGGGKKKKKAFRLKKAWEEKQEAGAGTATQEWRAT